MLYIKAIRHELMIIEICQDYNKKSWFVSLGTDFNNHTVPPLIVPESKFIGAWTNLKVGDKLEVTYFRHAVACVKLDKKTIYRGQTFHKFKKDRKSKDISVIDLFGEFIRHEDLKYSEAVS